MSDLESAQEKVISAQEKVIVLPVNILKDVPRTLDQKLPDTGGRPYINQSRAPKHQKP